MLRSSARQVRDLVNADESVAALGVLLDDVVAAAVGDAVRQGVAEAILAHTHKEAARVAARKLGE
jgi:hypothetical protein